MAQPPTHLWVSVLDDLALQMTRATYDTWLKGTEAIEVDDTGTLIIGTPSGYALEWLENRLHRVVEQTLQRHGWEGPVQFKVQLLAHRGVSTNGHPDPASSSLTDRPHPSLLDTATIELIEPDATRAHWIRLPAYSLRFWLPYLGRGPFLLWELLRSLGYTETRPTIERLAATLDVERQTIIGRVKYEEYVAGWLDKLEEENIVAYRVEKRRYHFGVLEHLPLLSPIQVATLAPSLQADHHAFVTGHKLNLTKWEQMDFDSFTPFVGEQAVIQQVRKAGTGTKSQTRLKQG